MSNNKMFQSAKYQAVIAIYQSEKVEGATSHRQRCIKRVLAETDMSPAGASTYYANVKAHFTDGVTEKVLGVQKVIEKVVSELWSCVKLDEDEMAVEVMVLHSLDEALKYSQEHVTYIMKGTQRYDAPLGTQAMFNADGDEIDEEGNLI